MVLTRQHLVYGAMALVAVVLAIWLLARSPSSLSRPSGTGKADQGEGFPDRAPGVKK